jgi:subtilisin-like proprotein convertase family protein
MWAPQLLVVLAFAPGCALIDGLGAACEAEPTYVPVGQTVPDNNSFGISSTVTAGFGTVSGVTVSADATHMYESELHYSLIHAGLSVTLDGKSEQDVTDFDGYDSSGDWTMNVYDGAAADEGYWYSWSIAICVD